MSTRVAVSVGRVLACPASAVRPVSLSADGKLLVLLLAMTLVGPYFPLFTWLGLEGWAAREVRADNLLLPALAAYVGVRSLASGYVRAPLHLILYGGFIAWLALVTVVWYGRVPEALGGHPGGLALLQGADAYVRPLLLMFITANVRVGRHDLLVIVRLVFVIAILLTLIAAAQLMPSTGEYVNRILASHYDNAAGSKYFWGVLSGGRVATLMPQLSTLGMYMVLVLGILAAQLLRARLVEPRSLLSFAVGAAALIGGILCGSKVFFAGLALTAGLGVFAWPWARRWGWKLHMLGSLLAVGVTLWMIVAILFPTQANTFAGRAPLTPGQIGTKYLATRFKPETGKVHRTGAVDVATDYPLTGLGLNAVNRTTDSLLLGLGVMSGGTGTAFYLATICLIGWRLYSASRDDPDPDLASLARMMAILTVVFLAAAIGFHTFIQDRAGDAYWIIAGLLLGSLAFREHNPLTAGRSPASMHPLDLEDQLHPDIRVPRGRRD